MVNWDELSDVDSAQATSYRLVNSKYPPIALFDDVADPEEFEVLYELQARTNPRLLNEAGRLEFVSRSDIPFGSPGCSYAVAPFTHINPAGSRFSDGSFGILYLADTITTALAEVQCHQQSYWAGVEGLAFDRVLLRGLCCKFDQTGMRDLTDIAAEHPIYDADSYAAARVAGAKLKQARVPGLRYKSVRSPGNICWGLFTPRPVRSMVQSTHYEMIWDGRAISSVNKISSV
ncbi:RES domain-containing protein [Halopseudomonas litoralis]|uniref:RES domain-containing protein n=1 Tax=Halopseudomonas litoralis TaxID=797277 RepID=A0A1H1QK78_9GAMM|nr:RES family NAD+ phosphorylase [Halopseudomonas litoralis]SDS23795.1 RES domain-containing protein [Halopseudomonas litoralis]